MAQVSISVADIAIGIEDEDASAKKLRAIASSIIAELVDTFGVSPAPEESEEEE